MDHDQSDKQRDQGLTHRGGSFGAVPEVFESDHEPVYCLLGLPREMIFYIVLVFLERRVVHACSFFLVILRSQ